MNFDKLPLTMKLILMQQIADAVIIDLEILIEEPVLTKEQIGHLGLRQAINVGEGQTELSERFGMLSLAMDVIDRLIVDLESHVKNVKV